MAYLSPDGRRGQILLVTGFALAIAIVGLALILNSVIYTENLATRADTTTSEPISHARALEAGTERILTYVNEYNTSNVTDYGGVTDNFSSAFTTFAAASMRQQLRDGQVTDDRVVNTFRATWVTQTNASRKFTSANASADEDWWPVDTGANGARDLRIFVNNTTELSELSFSPFTVTANNSTGGTWTMRIGSAHVDFNETGEAAIECSIDTSTLSDFWVNVSSGTVAGSECAGLDFGRDLGTIQGVEFVNGSNIEGTYRFMVNKSSTDIDSLDFGTGPDHPFTKDAIYGAVVAMDFERESLEYRTSFTVIPGEAS